MSTYQKCDESVYQMADKILKQFETHEPVLAAKVKIDFVFAYGERDEASGELKSDAIKRRGHLVLGHTRKISLKDRAQGRGDVEIALDHDWWEQASTEEKEGLLDHELHHIVVCNELDDLGRPKLKMRHHDVEIGWFAVVASRHGQFSQERIQAKALMESSGQLYWPALSGQAATGQRFTRLEYQPVAAVAP